MAQTTCSRRPQRSLDFIEANLREELPLKEEAGQANASLYHFHRLFRAFVGQSLKACIRGRRLTYAARDLVNMRAPLIDIALDYRYSTPESLLRAFKALYGMTPRAFRKRGFFQAAHEKADLMSEAASFTMVVSGAIGTLVNGRIIAAFGLAPVLVLAALAFATAGFLAAARLRETGA